MSKRVKLASKSRPAPVELTNWDICTLCQEHGGTLINPTTKGYSISVTNIFYFNELNKLPMNISIPRLDDGVGITETCIMPNSTKCVMPKTVERARKSQQRLNSMDIARFMLSNVSVSHFFPLLH